MELPHSRLDFTLVVLKGYRAAAINILDPLLSNSSHNTSHSNFIQSIHFRSIYIVHPIIKYPLSQPQLTVMDPSDLETQYARQTRRQDKFFKAASVSITEAREMERLHELNERHTSRLYYRSRTVDIINMFHALWPLVLLGCGFLEESNLAQKILWTSPIWIGSLFSSAYMLWLSEKRYSYFFPGEFGECLDARSLAIHYHQARFPEREDHVLMSVGLISRLASGILIADIWWCTYLISWIGWQQLHFGRSSTLEIALEGSAATVGIALLVILAVSLTKALWLANSRLMHYLEARHASELVRFASVKIPDELPLEEGWPVKSREAQQQSMQEKEMKNAIEKSQITRLKARNAELETANTHNDILAIGLRQRVKHLQDTIVDMAAKLPGLQIGTLPPTNRRTASMLGTEESNLPGTPLSQPAYATAREHAAGMYGLIQEPKNELQTAFASGKTTVADQGTPHAPPINETPAQPEGCDSIFCKNRKEKLTCLKCSIAEFERDEQEARAAQGKEAIQSDESSLEMMSAGSSNDDTSKKVLGSNANNSGSD